VLEIDLKGKKAFVAGIGDDRGYGWSIAKALAEAGAEIIIGTWAPIYNIFKTSWELGKFDQSRRLTDGSMMNPLDIYPMDASFDTPQEVPEKVRENKRYKACKNYTLSEVAASLARDFGSIDMLVHSLANAPEVKHSLLNTSRDGYLAAVSSSAYSFISLVKHCAPFMPKGGAVLSLTYIAAERAIPGYGGGMSSAKAALESDTRMLAWEVGRQYQLRVNTISAGALGSRAARAIGFIDAMIEYAHQNAPLQKALRADEVGHAGCFLLSPLASAITGVTLYVDNGLHAMGIAPNSPMLKRSSK